MNYGYVRVSTREQNEERQIKALQKEGVQNTHIYIDKCSGKDFERTGYRKLMNRLKPGDVLFVKSIDRLGRSYEDVLKQWRIITKEKEADIVVLDMELLDTRKYKDLTGTLIADIVLQLLSYVAQMEREFIRQRQAEGIALAKARGVRFGPRPMEKPEGFAAIRKRWEEGSITGRAAARELGISHRTFARWVREDETGEKTDIVKTAVKQNEKQGKRESM